MGPLPQLSDYQSAAQALYEPQKAAEQQSLNQVANSSISNLESSKNQIGTDYTQALTNLTNTTNINQGKIQGLYDSRMGGFFSGGEANDVGMMLSQAANQQSYIEQTRANKLNDISVQETNIKNTLASNVEGMKAKYNSQEVDYAQSGYGAAVKDYNANALKQQEMAQTNAYRNAQLGLSAARLSQSAANKSQSQYSLSGKTTTDSSGVKSTSNSNGYLFKGPSGEPVNMAQYVQGIGGSAQDIKNLLENGSSYDKSILNNKSVQKAWSSGDSNAFVKAVASADKNNAYGLR